MDKLKFTNADTAAKYEAAVSRDRTIHIPGRYSGKLSAIPPDVAQALIDMEDNQVKAKGAENAQVKPGVKNIPLTPPPSPDTNTKD